MLFRVSLSIGFMTAALLAQDRFDMKVREDFFSGFAGDKDAMARGMKACEATLAANPKHAEAMVWHGSGVFFESGTAVQAKDFARAGELYKRGLDEMFAAISLSPNDISVLIPRGATLLAASHNIPGDNGRQLLKTGLADYEKVYQLQAAYFDTLGGHAQGELLFGIAEGHQRLGDEARAREWFTSLRFSSGFVARHARGPWIRGARRSARGGVLDQYVEHGEQAQRSRRGPIACRSRKLVRNAG